VKNRKSHIAEAVKAYALSLNPLPSPDEVEQALKSVGIDTAEFLFEGGGDSGDLSTSDYYRDGDSVPVDGLFVDRVSVEIMPQYGSEIDSTLVTVILRQDASEFFTRLAWVKADGAPLDWVNNEGGWVRVSFSIEDGISASYGENEYEYEDEDEYEDEE